MELHMNQAGDEIQNWIPHRPPMLLVDEISECSERHIRGRKTFSGQEPFFAGHFPGSPILPGVILCEAGLQCGAILMARRDPSCLSGRTPVVTRLDRVKFKQFVRPGDTITMDVELKEQLAQSFFLHARIRCAGRLVTTFDFACTFVSDADVNSAPANDCQA